MVDLPLVYEHTGVSGNEISIERRVFRRTEREEHTVNSSHVCFLFRAHGAVINSPVRNGEGKERGVTEDLQDKGLEERQLRSVGQARHTIHPDLFFYKTFVRSEDFKTQSHGNSELFYITGYDLFVPQCRLCSIMLQYESPPRKKQLHFNAIEFKCNISPSKQTHSVLPAGAPGSRDRPQDRRQPRTEPC